MDGGRRSHCRRVRWRRGEYIYAGVHNRSIQLAAAGEPFARQVFPTQFKSLLPLPRRAYGPARMQAYVYKSQRKPDTFIYLARRDDFDVLPDPIKSQLGPFTFILEVALTPERRLARVDAAQVREQLAERGFFIQFPPSPLGSTGRNDE